MVAHTKRARTLSSRWTVESELWSKTMGSCVALPHISSSCSEEPYAVPHPIDIEDNDPILAESGAGQHEAPPHRHSDNYGMPLPERLDRQEQIDRH